VRLLLINDAASPIGGAELLTLSLRDEMRRRGHEVKIFSSDQTQPGAGPSEADYRCGSNTGRLQGFHRSFNVGAFRALRRAVNDFKPDLIHVRMFLTQLSPLILPIVRAYPSLYHVTNYGAVCPTGGKMLPDGRDCRSPYGGACLKGGCVSAASFAPLMLQMKLVQRWKSAFDLVVANSCSTREILREHGFDRVEVVWNGAPVTPAPRGWSKRPTVALAARLTSEKGVPVAIRAMRRVADRLPEAKLIVAGEGPLHDQVAALIDELNLREHVELMGHVERDRLDEVFGGAWAQLVPSRWREPFGLVAVEGMMRGVPVIASDSGGLSEIVEHGRTGFLVPPGDVDALADRMLELLGNQEKVRLLGAAARRRALKHFTTEVFLDQIEAKYERVLRVARDRHSTTTAEPRDEVPTTNRLDLDADATPTLAADRASAPWPWTEGALPMSEAQATRRSHDPASSDQASVPSDRPALTTILASIDKVRTLRRTIGHLQRQTIASRLQLVVVAPSGEGWDEFAEQASNHFLSLRFVRCEANALLGRQHALGVRAADAPYLAFCEDHCFPAPDWAEKIVNAFHAHEPDQNASRGSLAGLAVAIHNGNPRTALSWGNLMMGYLNWIAPLPDGPLDYIPGSNAVFRTDALLSLEGDLESLLRRGGEAQPRLRRAGFTFQACPEARVYHRNYSLWSSTFRLRGQIGRRRAGLTIHDRALGPLGRAAGVAMSPIDAGLRYAKMIKRLIARRYPLSRQMVFGSAVCVLADWVGVVGGYVLGLGDSEHRVHEAEFHREQHMRPEERDMDPVPAAPGREGDEPAASDAKEAAAPSARRRGRERAAAIL